MANEVTCAPVATRSTGAHVGAPPATENESAGAESNHTINAHTRADQTIIGRDDLTDNERAAFDELLFELGGPKTLRAIGERLGLSRERVRQIEVSALRKLRFASEPWRE